MDWLGHAWSFLLGRARPRVVRSTTRGSDFFRWLGLGLRLEGKRAAKFTHAWRLTTHVAVISLGSLLHEATCGRS